MWRRESGELRIESMTREIWSMTRPSGVFQLRHWDP
jgi:hypothetical protein